MINLICEKCNSPFGRNRWQKYCSLKCAHQSHTLHRLNNCDGCNKEFELSYKHQKYCSHSCAAKVTNLGRIPNWKIKIEDRANWNLVQEYYNANHSIQECIKYFSISNGVSSFAEAKKNGLFAPRKPAIDLYSYLIENSKVARHKIKKWLITVGLLKEICAICELSPHWQHQRLVLVLDHINGINDDYRLENLRLLCPNCNSQQPTFAGKNRTNPNRKCKPYYHPLRDVKSVADC